MGNTTSSETKEPTVTVTVFNELNTDIYAMSNNTTSKVRISPQDNAKVEMCTSCGIVIYNTDNVMIDEIPNNVLMKNKEPIIRIKSSFQVSSFSGETPEPTTGYMANSSPVPTGYMGYSSPVPTGYMGNSSPIPTGYMGNSSPIPTGYMNRPTINATPIPPRF